MNRYKCVIKDQYDLWLTKDKIYYGEQMIPPLFPNEAWLEIVADDGKKAFVRAMQFVQISSREEDILGV